MDDASNPSRTSEAGLEQVNKPLESDEGEADDTPVAAAEVPTGRGRRRRFRDRPRNWWLHELAGTDANTDPTRGSASRIHTPPPREQTATVQERPAASGRLPSHPQAPPTVQGRRRRGLVAMLLAVVFLALGLRELTHGTAPASTPAPTPAFPTPVPYVATAGTTLTATAVLGTGANLVAPREAVSLSDGRIAVADTGNSRLVLLGSGSRPLKLITSGATTLQEPYAIATSGDALYVLDAARGTIGRYDMAGHFQRAVLQSSLLVSARGMAVGRDGILYVANPRSNSVDVLSSTGTLLRQFTSALGAGPDQYNQPSDVAVGYNGTIYVLDNTNDRIKAITSSGRFLTQWPAPPSDTLHSVHLLPLPDGRLLASDPIGGSLLVYRTGSSTPTRLALAVPSHALGHIEPLGLARTRAGTILVTDGAGNRLLMVPVP